MLVRRTRDVRGYPAVAVSVKRVEPRGIEPLTSALPVRLEAVAVVRGCSKNRSFKPNS
jgi:hypothetical protein